MKKPGRRQVSRSPYTKKRLSSDARVIVALLKNQPQNLNALCKSAKVPLSTFYSDRPVLQNSGILKETNDGYALWFYDEAEEAVIKAIEKWRIMGFRDPDPKEIADEVNLSTEDAEAFARKTKDKTGWVTPNEGVKENASMMLGEALVCAARIRDIGLAKLKENFDYDEDPEIIEKTDFFLKQHPEMLPKLTEDEESISWPLEALKYLGKNYKPKPRHVPFIAVIPNR